MGHVFVSYSRKDKELVDRIVRLMFRSAIHVWLDREKIKAGKTWRVQIVEAIDTCDAFVLVLSSNSAASDNVRREIDLAQDSGRTIFPVMLEPIKLPADIRYQLAGLQFIDLQMLGFDVAVKQLISTVSAHRERLRSQTSSVSRMELVIQGIDLASFGESKKAELLDFISKLTSTNQSNLRIAGLAAGSVHVFIDMPPTTAFKLKTMALNREKRFKRFGIISLRIAGHSKFINIGLGVLTTTATIGGLHLLWLSLPTLFPSLFGITVGKVVLVTTLVTATTAVGVEVVNHPDRVPFFPFNTPSSTATALPTEILEPLGLTFMSTELPGSTEASGQDPFTGIDTLAPTLEPGLISPPASSSLMYSISNVQLNGTGNSSNVTAGSSVLTALDFQVWSQPDCPNCIDQIVIGLDQTPLFCAYHNIPGIAPGASGSNSNTIIAPSTDGTYTLYGFFTQQYSCADALALYSPETAIGTITVSGSPVPSYLRGDGDYSCPEDHTLATYTDAVIDTDLICSVLDTWDIARLEGGGSFDGPGYGCEFRSFDERSLGDSVCKLGPPIPDSDIAGYDVSNVQLNGSGSAATVADGPSVSVSLNYQVWNQTDCPACIDQIVIGLDNTPLYCAYDGIPGGEPGVSGSNSNTITAPSISGTYTLYAFFTQEYTCSDALAHYSPGRAIGTITIPSNSLIPSHPGYGVSNVQLNGSGSAATVTEGSSVSVSLNYQVWNQSDCQACIDQVVIGLDNTPLYCAYQGIPGVEPGVSGFNNNTITAPSTTGTYTLYAFFTQHYTCADAMAIYSPARAIGTITILPNSLIPDHPGYVVSNVQLNGSGSASAVAAGASVSASLNYQVWNQSDCQACIDQIVIGLDSTPLYCAYDGIPGGEPGVNGSNSNTITAPSISGTYTLYAFFTQDYTCADALARYSPGRAIGTITVSAPPVSSYIRGDGDYSCPFGYTLATYLDAVNDTNLICSALDTWDIARLEGGGSFDGPGYGCGFRGFDERNLGNSVCITRP